MKKLTSLVIVAVFISAFYLMLSSFDTREWSPSGRRSKLLNDAIATKNDSMLFSDFNRVYLAKSEPMHFYGTPEYMIESSVRILDPKYATIKLEFNHEVALRILEQKWGVDSVANYLHKLYNPLACQVYWKELYPRWDSLIQNLESKMSPELLNAVKKVVKENGLKDALWLKRYVSLEEIEKLIIQNEQGGDYDQWKVKWEKWFFLSVVDSSMKLKFLENITDDEILKFKMLTSISPERRWKLFEKTDLRTLLEYAHGGGNYFSGINNSELRRLFFSKRDEWKKESISELFYFPIIFESKEFLVELRSRSLKELINPGLTYSTEHWNGFPFYKYAEIVISKANSTEDYELAQYFFSKYDESGKGGWLALLNKKMLTINT